MAKRYPTQQTSIKRQEPQREINTQITATGFIGPLPPPEILRGYEEALPGTAERIIRMAEKEQDARLEAQSKTIDSEISDGRKGVIFAFTLGIGALAVAALVVATVPQIGGAIASAVIGMGGMTSIIGTLITSTRIRDKDKT